MGVALLAVFVGGDRGEPQVLRELLASGERRMEVRVEGLERDSTFLSGTISCDGEGRLPNISWSSVRGARAYAVFVVDPDAPVGDFYHLGALSVGESLSISNDREKGWFFTVNSAGRKGWFPVCSPRGHGTHMVLFCGGGA